MWSFCSWRTWVRFPLLGVFFAIYISFFQMGIFLFWYKEDLTCIDAAYKFILDEVPYTLGLTEAAICARVNKRSLLVAYGTRPYISTHFDVACHLSSNSAVREGDLVFPQKNTTTVQCSDPNNKKSELKTILSNLVCIEPKIYVFTTRIPEEPSPRSFSNRNNMGLGLFAF